MDDNHDMYWEVENDWYFIQALNSGWDFSWFNHCDNAEALQSSILLNYEEIYSEQDEKTLDEISFLKFKTNKGYCTIEFRNELSYYKGDVEITKIEKPDIIKLNLELLKDF